MYCGITNNPFRSFCESTDETPLHSFYEATQSNRYGTSCACFFHDALILPLLTPQTAIFGITDKFTLAKNRLLKNHILLIVRPYIYNSREKH